MNNSNKADTDQSVNYLKMRISHYLIRVGAENLQELSFEQRKKIFLLAIKDFMDEIFSIDALSSVGSKLWQYPTLVKSPDEEELNNVIYSCSEMSFYLRKIDSPDHSQFNMYIFDVLKYFKKYYPF